MILILSSKEDYTTNEVEKILNHKHVDYIRVNFETFNIGNVLIYKNTLSINDNVIEIDKITTVWFRKWSTPLLSVCNFDYNTNSILQKQV